ncbi:MAG: hypothetical protein K5898_04260 [Ruminococcus sp.]|uniref:hypothetical protein n=1 Tax=Ruminococcus sp. TaxID=41978 RepID=UPI0025D2241E|nr:hypothetical protein [Ruminococcus sp.]MCR4794378.1 hypothetical protein [Ruminococcus sp.]
MMDYKEMAEIVTREVDAILEKKEKRAARIKQVSLTVSGLCAAVLVCFGIWKLRPAIQEPKGFKDTDTVITTETATEITVTTTQTSPLSSTTTVKTKTTSTPKTTAAATSTAAIITTQRTTAAIPIRTSSPDITTPIPVSTRKITTTKAILTTTAHPSDVTTKTTLPTTSTGKSHATTASPTTGAFVVTTAPVTSAPSDVTTQPGGICSPPPDKNTMTEIFLASTATVEIKKNGTYVDYEKHNTLIESEKIGDFISMISVKMVHPDGTKQIISMGVYTIKDVNMEESVAVRLRNEYGFTEGYYLFTDPNYKKNDN